ncbi:MULTISPECIES: class I SAM-dependent methyltransferase [Dyadobacter]|uniref:Methyltransferase domain-containing protein n=1 Tax=Dyadobacter psychrotolerans TaxID=2541721 RepID=A0A4R5DMT5_9BACT|nr:class I SAM-dependent methyltransferase [Dyadobacter psychrotolerans]TDE13301.1 methyltransferase domain-containing protein [Dyadobacter psychrotolerans]
MNQFWDERYGSDEYIYGTMPNLWFKQNLGILRPGSLLLPAEGEGRNAVFAATQGWNVTAFDTSEVAKKKALLLAGNKKVSIDYRVGVLEDVVPRNERYDCIALIYAHLPSREWSLFAEYLITLLNPGGKIIFEGFSKQQLEYQERYQSGGPKDIDFLFSKEEIESGFKELTITYLRQEEIVLKEGNYHQGKASVIRMLAAI